ncbi:ROK family protein [Plantactinospora siamensis]|uniref:ROK family protein n=1 Tax=Plantactinospora siamensis TaxID=555372 RepID=A0ABV6P638_9ACTN
MTDVVLALDVGGTGIKAALVSPDGVARHTERHPTLAARGPAAVVDTIRTVAAGLADAARDRGWTPVAAGIVVPGVVNEATGVAAWSANVGFRDVPLRGLLRDHLGLPAALGHDVRAGGLAEARLGAGRGHDHVLFVAVGTGIAAAHVVRGSAAAGAHGAAGELGHLVVRPDGPPCGCGQRGCLEAVASAAAVARGYAARTGAQPAGVQLTGTQDAGTQDAGTQDAGAQDAGAQDAGAQDAGAPEAAAPVAVAGGPPITAAEVAARARSGDPAAVAVWRDTVDALADGLLAGQTLYDVSVIVVGGGLAEAGEQLLGPLRTALARRLTFHREPALVGAALGDEAGCLGAALLALDGLESS